MSDIVERLNAVAGNTRAHQFEIISLVPRAAAEITSLRQELANIKARSAAYDLACLDRDAALARLAELDRESGK